MTEAHDSWPAITLNFSQDNLPGVIDDIDAMPYYMSMLTIHILTKHYDDRPTSYINAGIIAKEIGLNIITAIEGWTTPLTGDIRIFDPKKDIKPFGNLGEVSDFSGVYDYTLSIDLHHA